MARKAPQGQGQRGRGRPRSPLPDVDRPNPFAIWIRDNDVDILELCKILGRTKSLLYGLRKGTRTPSLETAIRIEEVSGGAVPASSWKGR